MRRYTASMCSQLCVRWCVRKRSIFSCCKIGPVPVLILSSLSLSLFPFFQVTILVKEIVLGIPANNLSIHDSAPHFFLCMYFSSLELDVWLMSGIPQHWWYGVIVALPFVDYVIFTGVLASISFQPLHTYHPSPSFLSSNSRSMRTLLLSHHSKSVSFELFVTGHGIKKHNFLGVSDGAVTTALSSGDWGA